MLSGQSVYAMAFNPKIPPANWVTSCQLVIVKKCRKANGSALPPMPGYFQHGIVLFWRAKSYWRNTESTTGCFRVFCKPMCSPLLVVDHYCQTLLRLRIGHAGYKNWTGKPSSHIFWFGSKSRMAWHLAIDSLSTMNDQVSYKLWE